MIKKWKKIRMSEQWRNTDLLPHQLQLFSILNQNFFHSVSTIICTTNQLQNQTKKKFIPISVNQLTKKKQKQKNIYILKNGWGPIKIIRATPYHSSYIYRWDKRMIQQSLLQVNGVIPFLLCIIIILFIKLNCSNKSIKHEDNQFLKFAWINKVKVK